jgi:hypothetical protein
MTPRNVGHSPPYRRVSVIAAKPDASGGLENARQIAYACQATSLDAESTKLDLLLLLSPNVDELVEPEDLEHQAHLPGRRDDHQPPAQARDPSV